MPQCLDCFVKAPEAHCPQCVTDPLESDDFCGYDSTKLCVCCEQCQSDPTFEDSKGFADLPTVEPVYLREGVLKVYSICAVLEALFGPWDERPSYEEQGPRFQAWCEANKVHYYAAPRESFSEWVGFQLALDAGAEGVVMEDLS